MNADIVKAAVTKSRPGQQVGLGLEEHYSKSDGTTKIYVSEVGGLFREEHGTKIDTGDELLEVNGFKVSDSEQFPNGLNDVLQFLKGQWDIRVKVCKGSNDDSAETSATELSSSNDEKEQYMDLKGLEDDSELLDTPKTKRRKSKTKKIKYKRSKSDKSLKYDSDSGHSRKSTSSNKSSKSNTSRKLRRENSSSRKLRKEISKSKLKKESSRSKLKKENSRSKLKKDKNSPRSGHDRKRYSSIDNDNSQRGSPRSGHSRKKYSSVDNGNSQRGSPRSGHSRKKYSSIDNGNSQRGSPHSGHDRKRYSSIDNDNSQRGSPHSGHNRKRYSSSDIGKNSPRFGHDRKRYSSIDNDNSQRESLNQTSSPESENKIKGVVQCTNNGVMLEMSDGKRVSVDPKTLMALLSNQDDLLPSPASQKRGVNTIQTPRSMKKSMAPDKRSRIVTDDDDDDDDDSTQKMNPILQDLRNKLKKTNSDGANASRFSDLRQRLKKTFSDGGGPKNSSRLAELRKHARQGNSSDSLDESDVLSESSSAEEDDEFNDSFGQFRHLKDSMRNNYTMGMEMMELLSPSSDAPQKARPQMALRDLLGDRLKQVDPKKYEESSMVSSTMGCMTNLIEPGDMMKIKSCKARPQLKGATVEVIRKSANSIGQGGKMRWDVRILSRKAPTTASVTKLDATRMLSVAAENLKHFM